MSKSSGSFFDSTALLVSFSLTSFPFTFVSGLPTLSTSPSASSAAADDADEGGDEADCAGNCWFILASGKLSSANGMDMHYLIQ